MGPKDLPLYATLEKRSLVYRVYACCYFAGILGLIYDRIVYMLNEGSEGYWPWILVFVSKLDLAYFWVLEQAFRWCPIERKFFPQRLAQRLLDHLFSSSSITI